MTKELHNRGKKDTNMVIHSLLEWGNGGMFDEKQTKDKESKGIGGGYAAR
jgi:hypothetical protein